MKKIQHDRSPRVRPVPKEEVCEMCGLPWEWHKYATKDECIRLLRWGKRVKKTKPGANLSITGCTITGAGITSTSSGTNIGPTLWQNGFTSTMPAGPRYTT